MKCLKLMFLFTSEEPIIHLFFHSDDLNQNVAKERVRFENT